MYISPLFTIAATNIPGSDIEPHGWLHQGLYVERNYTTARVYWEVSASQGHSASQFYLGMLYFSGNGVEQDYTTAQQYFDECANEEYPDCLVALGTYHRMGKYGLPKNLTGAYEL